MYIHAFQEKESEISKKVNTLEPQEDILLVSSLHARFNTLPAPKRSPHHSAQYESFITQLLPHFAPLSACPPAACPPVNFASLGSSCFSPTSPPTGCKVLFIFKLGSPLDGPRESLIHSPSPVLLPSSFVTGLLAPLFFCFSMMLPPMRKIGRCGVLCPGVRSPLPLARC